MRVLFATDSTFPRKDGVAVTVARYQAHLRSVGLELEVLTPETPGLRRGPRLRVADGYDVSIYSQSVVAAAVLRADVVHIFSPAPLGLMARRIAHVQGRPTVISYLTDIEDYALLNPAAGRAAALLRLKWASRYFLGAALESPSTTAMLHAFLEGSTVLCPTPAVAQKVGAHVVPNHLAVLPLISELNLMPTDRRGESGDDLRVGYLGRLAAEKGIEFLIEAFSVMSQAGSVRLLVGGAGDKERDIRRLVKRRGLADRVEFYGEVDRHSIGAFFSELDVFAFPSLSDTQGIVLQEAAAAGVPIVLRDPRLRWIQDFGLTHAVALTASDFGEALLKLGAMDRRDVADANRAGLERLRLSADPNQLLEIYRRAATGVAQA